MKRAEQDISKAALSELQSEVLTVVSDPHLTWAEARTRLIAAINGSVKFVQPGFEQCPECGNLAMNPLPTCSMCGNTEEFST